MPSFLTPEWFAEVDRLVAAAGDLKIPQTMRAAEINLTITTTRGEARAYVKNGQLFQGHKPDAPTTVTLDEALARQVFIEADATAGIEAFASGKLVATGDLKQLVAIQTTEPSAEQKALAKRIAAITS